MEQKRNTIQRRLILNTVAELATHEYATHPTAEEVYEQIITKYPSISKATVYRNLSLMAEAGELLNIGSLNGSVHYDHNCHEHHHFLCTKCRKIFDINIDVDFSALLRKNKTTKQFRVTGYSLVFSGVCGECDV
jgi:Fe2+ or Zn2+ uptake regulation protein